MKSLLPRAAILLLLLIPLLTLTGCTPSTEPPFDPVSHPDQPLQNLGFSFLPPAGDDWYVAQAKYKTEWKVQFRKLPTSEDQKLHRSLFIMIFAESFKPDVRKDFPTAHSVLERMKAQLLAPDKPRFTYTTPPQITWPTFHDTEAFRCFFSNLEKDNHTGIPGTLAMDTDQILLIHPQDPGLTLWIICSQRANQGATPTPPIVKSILDNFLNSTKFLPLNTTTTQPHTHP